jgi:hypothetical protein
VNTRVKQLQLKAWQMAHAEIGNPSFENAIANRAQDILVELIVTECINKIEEVNNRHTDNYIDAALRDAAFEIETHFGVTG